MSSFQERAEALSADLRIVSEFLLKAGIIANSEYGLPDFGERKLSLIVIVRSQSNGAGVEMTINPAEEQRIVDRIKTVMAEWKEMPERFMSVPLVVDVDPPISSLHGAPRL